MGGSISDPSNICGRGGEEEVEENVKDESTSELTVFLKNSITLLGHTDSILCVEYIPCIDRLVSSDDRTVRIWDPSSTSCEKMFSTNEPIYCISHFHDHFFLTGSDKEILLWDGTKKKYIRKFDCDSGVNSICVVSENSFVSGEENGTMKVYSRIEKSKFFSWKVERFLKAEESKSINGGCVKRLHKLMGSNSLETKVSTKIIKYKDSKKVEEEEEVEGEKNKNLFMYVISCGSKDDDFVRLWNVNTRKWVRNFEGHTDWVLGISSIFMKDMFEGIRNHDLGSSEVIISGGNDKLILLFDPFSGEILFRIDVKFQVYSILSGDNFVAVSGLNDGQILFYTLEMKRSKNKSNGKSKKKNEEEGNNNRKNILLSVHEEKFHDKAVGTMCWANRQNTKYLVTGGCDKLIKFLDLSCEEYEVIKLT